MNVSTVALRLFLDRAKRIIDPKTPIAILRNIRMDANGKRLALSATNLEETAYSSVEAEVKKAFSVCVALDTFSKAIASIDSETVEIERTDKSLMLRDGRSKFRLPIVPSEDFPTVPEPPMLQPSFKLDGQDLARMFSAVESAICEAALGRMATQSLVIDVEAGSVVFWATDSHRVSRVERRTETKVDSPLRLVVNGRVAAVLASAGAGDHDVCHHEGHVFVQWSNADYLALRKVEAQIADLRPILGKEMIGRATISRPGLVKAARNVAQFTRAVDSVVVLALSEDAAVVSVASPDLGDAAISCAAKSPKAIRFGFEARYLVDALDSIRGDEVEIGWASDEGSPIYFRPVGAEDGWSQVYIVAQRNLPK